jgi:hypothetical protein
VQTFLPLTADFVETARSLDTRRLGKQRVVTLQIVRIALVFTSCLTARPVGEIGENRSIGTSRTSGGRSTSAAAPISATCPNASNVS